MKWTVGCNQWSDRFARDALSYILVHTHTFGFLTVIDRLHIYIYNIYSIQRHTCTVMVGTAAIGLG